jgi:hypothetical protein
MGQLLACVRAARLRVCVHTKYNCFSIVPISHCVIDIQVVD